VEVQVPSWESLSNCVESNTQESGGARLHARVLIFEDFVMTDFPVVVHTQSVQQGRRYTQQGENNGEE
jgi:hypothetical protein